LLLALLSHTMLCGAAEAQTFRAASSAGVTSGATALTITKPSGIASGDALIAAIAVKPNTATITPPSGWSLIRRTDQASATANSQAIYSKVAGSY
jgi:urease accessory protein UreH